MKIPSKIKKLIKDYPLSLNTIGRSEDIIYIVSNKYVLKISKNKERLLKEKEANDFLDGKLPVSKSIAYDVDDEYAYYLKSYLDGETLIQEKYLKNPDNLILLIKEAIDLIRNVDTKECKIKSPYSNGNYFTHGDLCLPNILVKDNKVSGFIDVSDAGIGDINYDYAWCIWSFEYNLKTKEHTPKLLKELGIEFNKELFNKYVDMEE